ncbi:cytidylate kinase-like family protein [Thomasclavelia cocleata]|uniref:Cytidylate kinase n=1 Tax=Thomasclavelia cocleata TaxID=69824 RepID=A0A1I0DFL3_9FIRM|nr:cytidylate kinase-like family protein [Thomasclavelia cocleata]MCR1961102.1 cytidylate kinase-like family protein [Thomasclavelia cocleata]NDO42624.1 cytidylate kinase-like family protein [Thomasclavelia cocleata]PJN80416.1 cytidylate kinase-like family protein [Thomasclavelia cocleata]SET31170.1 Cytidylate kinase [Thomasclavelia cocleata]
MNKIITISREFGSGGREIAQELAKTLNIPYYDKEILKQIAEHTKLAENYVEKIMETPMYFPFPILSAHSFSIPNHTLEQQNTIYTVQHKIIRQLAEKSSCIIVGRCSDYILNDMNPLKVFIYADIEYKIKRCLYKENTASNISLTDIRKHIVQITKDRASYYKFYTGQKWGEKENYDICFNASKFEQHTIIEVVSALYKNTK